MFTQFRTTSTDRPRVLRIEEQIKRKTFNIYDHFVYFSAHFILFQNPEGSIKSGLLPSTGAPTNLPNDNDFSKVTALKPLLCHFVRRNISDGAIQLYRTH
jgi:hypothetical protein